MIYIIKQWIKKLIEMVFSLFPMQNKVVFINFNGRGFGCNPKYIALEMLREQIDTEIVWLVSDLNELIPPQIKKVRWGSLLFYYELATAKIIVTNVKNALPFRKRYKQYLIQTWHGSNAYKYVEKEAECQLPVRYIVESKENSALTDLFISDSPKTSQWYRKSFWCTCEILESGMPRNDIFMNGTNEQKLKIRKCFKLNLKQKILLYAPTFRDNGSFDGYQLDFVKILEALRNRFSGDWKILLRLHPNVQKGLIIPTELRNDVFDASKYGDAQELIFASDALITDYSSICNDFILMNKPVFLYVSDLDIYMKNGRGLKTNYMELPMPKDRTSDAVAETIKKFNIDDYHKKIDEYKKKYLGSIDGHASERVVQKIKQYLSY